MSFGEEDDAFSMDKILEEIAKEIPEGIPLNKNSFKLAVVLHIYYTDLTNEFVNYLKNIPFNFDLYVSIIKFK